MPALSEVSYSREATIAAIRGYYHFLTKLYIDKSEIIEPPLEGWTLTELQCLGKSGEVMALLAHLPYSTGKTLTSRWLKSRSEPVHDEYFVPPEVIGLTTSRDGPMVLLDTKLGTILLYQSLFHYGDERLLREPIYEGPAVEDEVKENWRFEGTTWAVADFFEMLQENFRRLEFNPVSKYVVRGTYARELVENGDRIFPLVQEVYRTHGWPDLERYEGRKTECLAAVEVIVRRLTPENASRYYEYYRA